MRPIRLSILCWDHPRCINPVTAAASAWERRQERVTFAIKTRPLAAFNDQPITDIARSADLLFIDHPMVGRVAQEDVLVPLQRLLGSEVLSKLAADSIGGSHNSYNWEGRQWAAAVDAACQVAVVDDDRIGGRADVPRRWADVLLLARQAPGSVAIPLYPSDAVLSLLSISADLRAGGLVNDELWSAEAVDVLVELARVVDPRSFELNPPGLLELMSSAADDVPFYAPLLFGYTNYQRPDARGRRLRFCSPPSVGETPAAVLGGAGLAVSASCGHPNEAAEFAAWMAGAEAQRAVVLPNDGQPASRSVWLDAEADTVVGGFFSGTRTTIEASYVRPRDPWWPRYQEAAGLRLVGGLRHGEPAGVIHTDLIRLMTTARSEEYAR
jgi:multiple sugar transport system substrate-binding protein